MLCDFCAQIPLDPEALNKRNHDKYPLGPIARVKDSSCPFCRIVSKTLSEGSLVTGIRDETELTWMPGLFGRLSFSPRHAAFDTWICFRSRVEPSADQHTIFIEPETAPTVDTSRMLDWVSSCERLHGSKCALTMDVAFDKAFRTLKVLRLLDVQTNCLVEITSLEKYVALSYVWGSVSSFRLTTINRPALLNEGSLKKVAESLPNTINDAIILTRHLGCRYLWVDALCLLQNDTEDLYLGVNSMDLIYERAWLTVVAACGHDANARLPGVRESTRNAHQNTYEVCPGVEVGIVTGLDTLLRKSVYNTRAWTFQEQVLSRRVLYFVDDKVFYRCRAAEHAEHFSDDLSQNRLSTVSLGSLLPHALDMSEPIFDFSAMLFYYTQRRITNQNDASRAMAGITKRFENATRCRFFQDLPTAMFDRFIIFQSVNGLLHRCPSFPSYSWTGWTGQMGWKGCVDINTPFYLAYEDTNHWLEKKTWIIWYKRSPSGITSLVWDPTANPLFPIQDMEYCGYRTRSTFADGRHVPLQVDTSRTLPTEQIAFSGKVPSYPLLQFWTLSLVYHTSGISSSTGHGYLEDLNQKKCGFIFLDVYEGRLYPHFQEIEVVLLSEAYSHAILDKEPDLREPYSFEHARYNPNDRTTRHPLRWSFYYVMLLEWQGGIAERRGLGLLHQNAVDFSLAPGPTWKEIFLA